MPLAVTAIAPLQVMIPVVTAATLAALAVLGWLGAWAGGAPPLKSVIRVTFWGVLALAATALIGKAFGAVV